MKDKDKQQFKSLAKNSPLKSPLPESHDREVEKKYISLLTSAREEEYYAAFPTPSIDGVVREKREREPRNIYKTINTVIPRPRRYRKNAVRERCRQFVLDLQDHGFPVGVHLHTRDLKYWIKALDLAHDKITVDQYVERLVIFNYFIPHKDGTYVFSSVLPAGQVTLVDPKVVRSRLRASLRRPRKRKAW